jgi:hypothetical protein
MLTQHQVAVNGNSRSDIIGGNHLILDHHKTAYGTRGYEVKTLIIKEKRNPPLAMQ